MKQVLVFLAVYTASLAVLVVLAVVGVVVDVAIGRDTGVLFSFTPASLSVLLLMMLLLGVFASWVTRKLLRSRAANTENAR